jgi:hypothetical protein
MIMKHLSALVLAAGFLGTVAVTSASAQVARDQSYYEEVRVGNCSIGNCALEFSTVPQLILFSKVNCFVAVTGGILYAVVFEIRDVSGATSPTRRREFLQFPSASTVASTNYYNFVNPTDFMVSAPRLPVVEAFLSGGNNGSIECKITGRLVSDPH